MTHTPGPWGAYPPVGSSRRVSMPDDIVEMLNSEMVKLYVDTVNGPVNGWGQSIVNAPGSIFDGKQSRYLLYAIKQRMGWNTADEAINAEFSRRKLAK